MNSLNPDETAPSGGRVPKAVYYSIALLILIAGWGGAAMLGWRMVRIGTGLMLLNAPGSKAFRLAPGEYTLYHEFEGVADNKIYYQPLAAEGLAISLKEAGESGSAVKLATLEPRAVYAFGSRHGAEIARFTIDRAGDYLLEAPAAPNPTAPATVLAIGDGRERETVLRFQQVLGLTLLSTVLSAGLWLWTTLRADDRNRRRK